MSQPPTVPELREELTAYYGPLLPYWDETLASRGDLAFWRERVSAWGDAAVLELGCGNGRVTEVLARGAARVVGLDLNLEALRAARGRLAGLPSVELIAADMRSFALGRRFPIVAAANDPFSHLRSDDGRRAAMARAAEHLEPGGRLVLDALWFPEGWLEEARSGEGKLLEFSPDPDRDGPELLVRHRWRCPPEGRVCTASFEVLVAGRSCAEATFRGRAWTMEELERRLSGAGLVLDRALGDYDGGAWHPESERLVVEAVSR